MFVKKQLYQMCRDYVDNKRRDIQEALSSLQSSLEQEARSSAGDQYETGRSMLHLEMEKTQEQLDSIRELRSLLDNMELSGSHEIVRHGSLVITDQGKYFISVSAGALQTEDGETYYAVSPSSPIGTLLIGKKKGDQVAFRDREFKILELQ